MLVEPDCLCFVQAANPEAHSIINEKGAKLLVGLMECEVPNVTQMVVSQMGHYIIVANRTMMQIFSTMPVNNQI